MTMRLYRYLQATILVFLGIFLVTKFTSGTLSWYIHQRFFPLTFLGLIALFLIGQALWQEARQMPAAEHFHTDDEEEHTHWHVPSSWQLGIVALPLLVGLLIPARPLDTQALDGKEIRASAPVTSAGAQSIRFDVAADERNILDWIQLFNSERPASSYLGQSANVIGFVYHDPRLPENQFLVSRFTVTCCAADAFALGMIVEWPQTHELQDNAWVKVKGPVQARELGGSQMPFIQADSIEPVQQPDQPYLFP